MCYYKVHYLSAHSSYTEANMSHGRFFKTVVLSFFVAGFLLLINACSKDSTTAPRTQQTTPHYIIDYYVDEATVVLDSLAAVARYSSYYDISELTRRYPIPELVDQHWMFGTYYDDFGYIWIRAIFRNGLFSDNIRTVTYNLRTNSVTRENIEILPLPVHLDPSLVPSGQYQYEDSLYCIDQISSYPGRLVLRKIYWGYCEYIRHHGEDDPYPEIMFDSNYVSLSDEVRQNWVFTIIGRNPITQFQAVSTESMPRGAGYTITIDRMTGRMYGSGTGLGDE